jgi:hypothetical protein
LLLLLLLPARLHLPVLLLPGHLLALLVHVLRVSLGRAFRHKVRVVACTRGGTQRVRVRVVGATGHMIFRLQRFSTGGAGGSCPTGRC